MYAGECLNQLDMSQSVTLTDVLLFNEYRSIYARPFVLVHSTSPQYNPFRHNSGADTNIFFLKMSFASGIVKILLWSREIIISQ